MGKAVVALLSANGLGSKRGTIAMAGTKIAQSSLTIGSAAVNGQRRDP